MRKGRKYRVVDRAARVVAAFIDRSTEHEQLAAMTRMHTRNGEIVSEVTEEVELPT